MQPTDKSGERRIRVDDYSRLLDCAAQAVENPDISGED